MSYRPVIELEVRFEPGHPLHPCEPGDADMGTPAGHPPATSDRPGRSQPPPPDLAVCVEPIGGERSARAGGDRHPLRNRPPDLDSSPSPAPDGLTLAAGELPGRGED